MIETRAPYNYFRVQDILPIECYFIDFGKNNKSFHSNNDFENFKGIQLNFVHHI